MTVPEWAKDIRVSRHGIVFNGGASLMWQSSQYKAGPYTITSMFKGEWSIYEEEACYLWNGHSFRRARWFCTLEFFQRLLKHVEHKDVKTFFLTSWDTGDWTKALVLVDLLDDLGFEQESALVKSFIPKRV